jgi:glutaredoxin 3
MAITLYATTTCQWCKKTKEYLEKKKIKFKHIFVDKDEKARDKMIELSGQMGVPVLDVDGEVLVGYDPDAIDKMLKK